MEIWSSYEQLLRGPLGSSAGRGGLGGLLPGEFCCFLKIFSHQRGAAVFLGQGTQMGRLPPTLPGPQAALPHLGQLGLHLIASPPGSADGRLVEVRADRICVFGDRFLGGDCIFWKPFIIPRIRLPGTAPFQGPLQLPPGIPGSPRPSEGGFCQRLGLSANVHRGHHSARPTRLIKSTRSRLGRFNHKHSCSGPGAM